MGQGVTIIQALPNLLSPASEYNTAKSPFWAGMPGPSNPWPVLFTFVNGAFSISGMTITDPYGKPAQSWWWYGGSTPETALMSAIVITGEQQASASIDHVTVIGASGDVYGTNMYNGVVYGGWLLPPGWTDAYSDLILISGIFSVTNSVFNTVETGPWAGQVDGATITVCYNTAINAPGWTYTITDLYNSKATVCGNYGSASQFLAAIAVYQDWNVPPSKGVLYWCAHTHTFQTNRPSIYDGYTAIGLPGKERLGPTGWSFYFRITPASLSTSP